MYVYYRNLVDKRQAEVKSECLRLWKVWVLHIRCGRELYIRMYVFCRLDISGISGLRFQITLVKLAMTLSTGRY